MRAGHAQRLPACRRPGATAAPPYLGNSVQPLLSSECKSYVMLGSPARAQPSYHGDFTHKISLPRNERAFPVPAVIMGGLLEMYESG